MRKWCNLICIIGRQSTMFRRCSDYKTKNQKFIFRVGDVLLTGFSKTIKLAAKTPLSIFVMIRTTNKSHADFVLMI